MEKIYGYIETEKSRVNLWQEQEVYKFDKNSEKKLFSVDTPPPTVSGTLHIGHIFSYTQTDIIARFKRMSGFNVFYPFGFDDNGLPTERYVEKKLGVSGYKLGRANFIELCLKESHEVEELFKNLWKRMGFSVDWSYTYSTIDKNVRKLSQESFLQLLEKNYVYRKNEPALYCTSCFTSVAQAELDDHEAPSIFNDIIFKSGDKELVVATTRPELLASCVALIFNPNDDRYKHLIGKKATVPFYGFEVEIISDESVLIEKGTGLVMCCTFGDKKDVEWYKKFNFKYRESIARDGRMTELSGPLAGLKVKEAREKIIELLKENGLLINQKQISHNVNVHERCKKDIEIIEIPQWFVKILEFKKEFIELAEKISWHPAYMKNRYINWVENISWDWCISRQRFYGIPFPVWYCKDCSNMVVASKEELPIDPQQINKICSCGSKNLVPDTDVMDTWNTSSITPYICASFLTDKPFEDSKYVPMGMRPQAHDIIRTWAFDTIVKSWMHSKDIPWNDIVISGHVLAAGKEKISKSKGNEPFAPENLLQNYTADSIRYWTASGSLGQDMVFSDTQLKIGNKLITKLWNAFKFCHEHVNFDTKKPQDLGIINRWICNQLQETFDKYNKYFENYEFGLALSCVEKLFWSDFCDNYLEIIKNQFFNPDLYDTNHVAATRWTLGYVSFRILQLYAPYVPFITEEIYELMLKEHIGAGSIHLTQFDIKDNLDANSIKEMEKILELIEKIRKLKTEHQLSLKTDIETLNITCDNSVNKIISENSQIIKGVTRAININFVENAQDGLIKQETITVNLKI